MGKKNQRWQQRAGRQPRGGAAGGQDDDDDGGGGDGDSLPSATYDPDSPVEEQEEGETGGEEEVGEEERVEGEWSCTMAPSKFHLYQKSVQSPRGDISYMQKFFLMYVGGRMPLHLREDFCGTALISAEWLHSDPRRTAIGIDLDLGALHWCLRNNLNKIGADGYSRISLFHGNVLCPEDALHVKPCLYDLVKEVTIGDQEGKLVSVNAASESSSFVQNACTEILRKKDFPMPPCDIVCAFNYSCCCLHKRADLVLYFKHALDALSKRGGIFVMDLYGGSSSECKLKLRRRFPDFTYVWEQQAFDIITRTTRISLHFLMGNKHTLRHAFSYHWRLWSLPEIKDCLEEAGFESVHFWVREMPDTREGKSFEQCNSGKDVKYEEIASFQQTDGWNAYIVGVAHRPRP